MTTTTFKHGVHATTNKYFPELNWANGLSCLGISIPLLLGGVRIAYEFRSFKAKLFPNIFQMQLHTIVKCNQFGTYRIYMRTIFENELKNLIFNEQGMKSLQKAWRKCIKHDTRIVNVSGNLRDQHFICNALLTKLDSQFKELHFMRDMSITRNMSGNRSDRQWSNNMQITHNSYIKSNMYVFAIANTNINNRKNKYKFTQVYKIRGFLIQEQAIKQLLCDFGDRIHTMTADEWHAVLDSTEMDAHMTSIDNSNASVSVSDACWYGYHRRWSAIHDMVKQYDLQEKTADDQIIWGKPLCLFEIPQLCVGAQLGYPDNDNIFIPPIGNTWYCYKGDHNAQTGSEALAGSKAPLTV